MERKKIYDEIRKLNLAEEVKKTFGQNFTRVSSANLMEFIEKHKKGASKGKVINKAKCTKPNAMFYLASLLLSKRVITENEFNEFQKMI